MSEIYSNPEEKLWFVVGKHLNGVGGDVRPPGAGIKLEKNSIIRMGRIRLRVRDIDYPDYNATTSKDKEDVAKSARSQSPTAHSQRTRQAPPVKSGQSTNRRDSGSINEIELDEDDAD